MWTSSAYLGIFGGHIREYDYLSRPKNFSLLALKKALSNIDQAKGRCKSEIAYGIENIIFIAKDEYESGTFYMHTHTQTHTQTHTHTHIYMYMYFADFSSFKVYDMG